MKNKSLYAALCLFFFWLNAAAAQQGLIAEYYDGINFERKAATRIDANIDFYWNNTPPVPGIDPHVCSVRWKGRLKAPESGVYTFSAMVDDGIRVWVGGVQVIDAWDLHDVGRFTGEVKLEEGKEYELTVEYFNALVEAEIRLLWKLPSMKSSIGSWFDENPVVIAAEYFSHVPATPPAPKVKPPVAQAEEKPAKKSEPQPPAPKKTPPKPKKQPDGIVHADTLEKYIPKNVMFEQGESVLLPGSFAELDNLAAFLNRNPAFNLTIEGHTDVAGDPAKNWRLSERRANAVAAYLVRQGVAADRLTAEGFGSSQPIVESDGKTYHPENRRVEFIIE